MKPYVIGISGGSASGKTSFLRELRKRMPEHAICVVSQDNYYLPPIQQQRDENNQINFDLPTSIDRKRFHADIIDLIEGKAVELNEYTFNLDPKLAARVVLNPAPIIIVEGLFIFHFEEIRNLLDLKVYIDAKDEIKLARRLNRDATERGYDEETILYQWYHHVMPSYTQYLKPYKEDSDIIIINNQNYDNGLAIMSDHLKEILNKGNSWNTVAKLMGSDISVSTQL